MLLLAWQLIFVSSFFDFKLSMAQTAKTMQEILTKSKSLHHLQVAFA
jgi:hypothetical protein